MKENISLAEILEMAGKRLNRDSSEMTLPWNRIRSRFPEVTTVEDLQVVVLGPRKEHWETLAVPVRLKVALRQILLEMCPLAEIEVETPSSTALFECSLPLHTRRLSLIKDGPSPDVPLTRKRRPKFPSNQSSQEPPSFPSPPGQYRHAAETKHSRLQRDVLTEHLPPAPATPANELSPPNPYKSQELTSPPSFLQSPPTKPDFTPGSDASVRYYPTAELRSTEVQPSAPEMTASLFEGLSLNSPASDQMVRSKLPGESEITPTNSPFAPLPPSQVAEQQREYLLHRRERLSMDRAQGTVEDSESQPGVPQHIQDSVCPVPQEFVEANHTDSSDSESGSTSIGSESSEYEETDSSNYDEKSDDEEFVPEVWVCPECTLENSGDPLTCQACGHRYIHKPHCSGSETEDSKSKKNKGSLVSKMFHKKVKFKRSKKSKKKNKKSKKEGKGEKKVTVKLLSKLKRKKNKTKNDENQSDGVAPVEDNPNQCPETDLTEDPSCWKCPLCTLENSEGMTCSACCTPKPAQMGQDWTGMAFASTQESAGQYDGDSDNADQMAEKKKSHGKLGKFFGKSRKSGIDKTPDVAERGEGASSSNPNRTESPFEVEHDTSPDKNFMWKLLPQPMANGPLPSSNPFLKRLQQETVPPPIPDNFRHPLEVSPKHASQGSAPVDMFQPIQEPAAVFPGSSETLIAATLLETPMVYAVAYGDNREENVNDQALEGGFEQPAQSKKKGKLKKVLSNMKALGTKSKKSAEIESSQKMVVEAINAKSAELEPANVHSTTTEAPVSSSPSRPLYWTPTEGVVQINLQLPSVIIGQRPSGNTLSVDYLLDRFETLPKLSRGAVLQLYRNQNNVLWEEYTTACARMMATSDGSVKEKMLFFGGAADDVEAILKDGFGLQHLDPNDPLCAIYLSKSADVAHCFSQKGGAASFQEREAAREDRFWNHQTQVYKMLFCRVVTGNHKVDTALCYSNNSGDGIHELRAKCTAVSDFQHIFPEFLLLYKFG